MGSSALEAHVRTPRHAITHTTVTHAPHDGRRGLKAEMRALQLPSLHSLERHWSNAVCVFACTHALSLASRSTIRSPLLALAAILACAAAYNNGMGLTPPLGWNTWFAGLYSSLRFLSLTRPCTGAPRARAVTWRWICSTMSVVRQRSRALRRCISSTKRKTSEQIHNSYERRLC